MTSVTEHPNVIEARQRAADVRASLDDATLTRVDELVASIPDLLARCYCGPPNAKGRQAMWFRR